MDKKKKAAVAAAIYYLQLEKDAQEHNSSNKSIWIDMGRKFIMEHSMKIQRLGRSLPIR